MSTPPYRASWVDRLLVSPAPRWVLLAGTVWAAVDKESAELGHSGRVLLRRSGTEPIVRVMVEAATEADASAVAERIAAIVEAELSLG